MNPDVLCKFQAKLDRKFAPLQQLQNPEELEKGFSEEIHSAAEEILGLEKRIKQPWITEEALDMCDRRRELKKRRFERMDEHEIDHTLEYREANNATRQKLREARETWINTHCQSVEDNLNAII